MQGKLQQVCDPVRPTLDSISKYFAYPSLHYRSDIIVRLRSIWIKWVRKWWIPWQPSSSVEAESWEIWSSSAFATAGSTSWTSFFLEICKSLTSSIRAPRPDALGNCTSFVVYTIFLVFSWWEGWSHTFVSPTRKANDFLVNIKPNGLTCQSNLWRLSG